MKALSVFFYILLFNFISLTCHAVVKLSLDYGTLQENRSTTNISSISRNTYDAQFGVSLNQSQSVYLVIGYFYSEKIENFEDAEFNTYTTEVPYLGVSYYLWPKNTFNLLISLSYSPFANLALTQPTGVETWNGTAVLLKSGINANLSKKTSLLFSLTYIAESFTQKISGSVTGDESISQTSLAPAIGLSYKF